MAMALSAVQIIAIIAVLWRLVRSRIHLPVFAIYLLVDLLLGGVAVVAAPALSMNTAVYVWAYGQLLVAALWILIADELRRRMLVNYRGVGGFGSVVVIVAIVVASIAVWLTATDSHSHFTRAVIFVPRVIVTALTLAVASLAAFVTHYPAHQAPNTMVHGRTLGLYFGGQSLSLLAVNVSDNPQAMSLVGMVLSMICFGYWTLALSAAGEAVPTPAANLKSGNPSEARERSERALAGLRDLL